MCEYQPSLLDKSTNGICDHEIGNSQSMVYGYFEFISPELTVRSFGHHPENFLLNPLKLSHCPASFPHRSRVLSLLLLFSQNFGIILNRAKPRQINRKWPVKHVRPLAERNFDHKHWHGYHHVDHVQSVCCQRHSIQPEYVNQNSGQYGQKKQNNEDPIRHM